MTRETGSLPPRRQNEPYREQSQARDRSSIAGGRLEGRFTDGGHGRFIEPITGFFDNPGPMQSTIAVQMQMDQDQTLLFQAQGPLRVLRLNQTQYPGAFPGPETRRNRLLLGRNPAGTSFR